MNIDSSESPQPTPKASFHSNATTDNIISQNSEKSIEKIKYSRKSEKESGSVPIDRYIPGMTRKQIIKTIANIENKKIYSTSDARKVAAEIEAMLVFEDSYGKLSGKGDITEQVKVKIKKRQAHLEACRFLAENERFELSRRLPDLHP